MRPFRSFLLFLRGHCFPVPSEVPVPVQFSLISYTRRKCYAPCCKVRSKLELVLNCPGLSEMVALARDSYAVDSVPESQLHEFIKCNGEQVTYCSTSERTCKLSL